MVNLTQHQRRTLFASGLLVFGTVAGGFGTVAGEVLKTVLPAITGGILANDLVPMYLNRLGVRLWGSGEKLANHDLTDAVGLAMGWIIQSIAEAGTYPNSTEDLKRLAKKTVEAWPKVAQDLKGLRDEDFDPIQDEAISQLFSGTMQEFLASPVLREEDWRELLQYWLCPQIKKELKKNVLNEVAKQLHQRFPLALREVLKADFEKGGKAFAGLTLSLLGEMQGVLKVLSERSEREDSGNFEASREQLEMLQKQLENNAEEFRKLGENIDSGFAEVLRELGVTEEKIAGKVDTLQQWLQGYLSEIIERLDGLIVDTGKILGIVNEIREEITKAKIINQQSLDRETISTFVVHREHTRPSTKNFRGRKVELQQLKQWKNEADCIGIIGDGGYGKSTLAAKCYEDFEEFGKQNKFWVDLRQGNDFKQLAIKIIEKFTSKSPQNLEKESDISQIVGSLINFLRDEGRYLLVLDNLETLLTLEGEWKDKIFEKFLTQWQQCGEKSVVLLTTRIKPEGRKIEWLSLGSLDEEAGADLLRVFKLTDSADTLKEYSRLLKGRPLSLEIFAYLVRQGQKQELTELLNDPEVKNQTDLQLVLLLQRSFNNFSETLQSFLLCLTVYSKGTFTGEEAQVQFLENIGELENVLQQFVDGSLLQQQEENNKIYKFHPEVLRYLQKKVGDLTEAHQRAISFYQGTLKPREEWEMVEDVGEYLEIFHHRCELGEYETAFDSIYDGQNIDRDVDRFLDLRGYNQLRIELYTRLVAGLSNHEDWRYTASLTSLGNAYDSLGDYQRAIALHQQSLEIEHQIGNRRGEAACLGNLGNAYDSLGEYQQAIALHQQQLEIARQIGDRGGEANSLGNLGNAYGSLGEYQQAIAFLQQSLEIKRQIGDRGGEAASLGNLGYLYYFQEQFNQAIDYIRQSLIIKRDIGDRAGEANQLNNLGETYDALEDYQKALSLYQEALTIAEQIKFRHLQAETWFNLGNTLTKLNRIPDALGAYRNAKQLYQEMKLDRKVQDCDKAIQNLESPPSRQPQNIWQKLRQFFRSFRRFIDNLFQ